MYIYQKREYKTPLQVLSALGYHDCHRLYQYKRIVPELFFFTAMNRKDNTVTSCGQSLNIKKINFELFQFPQALYLDYEQAHQL